MASTILTAARVRELLDLSADPPTWRTSIGHARVGDIAGGVNAGGYWVINIDRRRYYAHRLVWLAAYGTWPREIDHLNGNQLDNRIENLRDVSRSVNSQNQHKAYPRNKSCGLLGVARSGKKRWMAKIRVAGKGHYLGSFDTPEEAHAVYLVAKRRLHPGCTI